jgi:hypothetical protein
MNKDELELAKVTIEALLKPYTDLIERLFGGAVDFVGGMLEDAVRERRQRRTAKVLAKLQAAIEDAKIETQPIPDSIWIPALQEASLQDDETLQERWAWLLANASDPDRRNLVEPAFLGILKELSPREVRFLDVLVGEMSGRQHMQLEEFALTRIYMQSNLTRYGNFPNLSAQSRPLTAYSLMGQENGDDFHLMMDVLELHRIISRVPKIEVTPSRQPITAEGSSYYTLTQFGLAFVRACQKPT